MQRPRPSRLCADDPEPPASAVRSSGPAASPPLSLQRAPDLRDRRAQAPTPGQQALGQFELRPAPGEVQEAVGAASTRARLSSRLARRADRSARRAGSGAAHPGAGPARPSRPARGRAAPSELRRAPRRASRRRSGSRRSAVARRRSAAGRRRRRRGFARRAASAQIASTELAARDQLGQGGHGGTAPAIDLLTPRALRCADVEQRARPSGFERGRARARAAPTIRASGPGQPSPHGRLSESVRAASSG